MAVRELTWTERAGVPTDRDLDPAELEALATHVAANSAEWAHHIAFDSDERVYDSIHRDHHVDVWLLCWTPENDTGWHDHDVSSGAVAVVSGELVENNLTLADGARERRVAAGTSFSFASVVAERTDRPATGVRHARRRPRECVRHV